jgi:hypothetical protein
MTRGTKFLIVALLSAVTSSGAVASAQAATPVSLPFELSFSSDQGGIADGGGRGTGFTVLQGPGGGLRSDLLALDTADPAGLLRIRTTPGIAYRALNSQDNGLGVTVPADGRAVILETTIVTPPTGSGRYEQAGIWYGTSQDDYVKLVLISRSGLRVHMLHEGNGLVRKSYYGPPLASAPDAVTLRLRVDLSAGSLTGAYEIDGQVTALASWRPLPAGLVSGGISHGGIFATQRLGASELEYSFDRFRVNCASASCPVGPAPYDPALGDGTDPVGVPDEGEVDKDPATAPSGGSGSVSTGTGAPVGGTVGAPPDRRPQVSASARRRIGLRALRRDGLSALVRCSERCDVRVDLLARKTGRPRFSRVAVRDGIVGVVQRRIRIRIPSHAFKRLRGVSKLKLRVHARFVDDSTASVIRRMLLRR